MTIYKHSRGTVSLEPFSIHRRLCFCRQKLHVLHSQQEACLMPCIEVPHSTACILVV